jgi:hypothetical protein
LRVSLVHIRFNRIIAPWQIAIAALRALKIIPTSSPRNLAFIAGHAASSPRFAGCEIPEIGIFCKAVRGHRCISSDLRGSALSTPLGQHLISFLLTCHGSESLNKRASIATRHSLKAGQGIGECLTIRDAELAALAGGNFMRFGKNLGFGHLGISCCETNIARLGIYVKRIFPHKHETPAFEGWGSETGVPGNFCAAGASGTPFDALPHQSFIREDETRIYGVSFVSTSGAG